VPHLGVARLGVAHPIRFPFIPNLLIGCQFERFLSENLASGVILSCYF